MSLIYFRLRLFYKRTVKKNKEKCLEKGSKYYGKSKVRL